MNQEASTKRFFDDLAVNELFGSGWEMLSVEHIMTGRNTLGASRGKSRRA